MLAVMTYLRLNAAQGSRARVCTPLLSQKGTPLHLGSVRSQLGAGVQRRSELRQIAAV